MKKTALVIMAAGIGSRFGGGIKQLEPVGPNGEIIMDYSIHDALEAGFDRIIFVIRHDLDEQDIHPESWELMMDLGGSFRDLGENPLENYLDGEISEDVSIYSVYYSDTLESYEGILCEIGGIEVEALISGKTEIVNP